jgi:hypothetical protein
MSQGDIFAITPTTSATLLKASGAIGGAGDITLLTNDVSPHGTGYKILFTCAGADAGRTFTITGIKVGDLTGAYTTEAVSGASASTSSSTNFYTYIDSISIDAASAGAVSIGTTGSLAFGRTRIKSLYYVGNSTSGALLLQIDTPTSAASFSDSVTIPDQGILTQRSNSKSDFTIMTLTNITNATVFCG